VDATWQSRDINNNSSSSSDDLGAVIKAEIKEWIKKEEGTYKVSTIIIEIDSWL
jgi:tetrahydromethanopterin S-methyltransferase subunit A